MPLCQLCETDIETDDALVEHKKMRINLKCQRCGRPFVNYCALEGHLNHAHKAIPIRAPGEDRSSTATETGETEQHARPASSSQETKDAEEATRPTNDVTDSKGRSKTTSASTKETTTHPDESTSQGEVQRSGEQGEFLVGRMELSPLEMGAANRMACPTCNKAEGSLMTLRVHQVVQEHCYCKECKAFFLNDGALKVHNNIVHRFICKECSKVFATPEKLQGHQVQSEHCYCKSCNSFFLDSSVNANHSAKVHVYPCGLCKDVFRYQKDLVEHQNSLRHFVTCVHCTAKFSSRQDLAKHVEQDHTPCNCSKCQYGYDTAEELRAHQKAAVSFYCMVCNITFQSDQATEAHNDVILHEPVACKKCGRHFLNGHALSVHATSKQKCP